MTTENNRSAICWFAMRDLKRTNAKDPAYKVLTERGFEVFTPMTWRLKVKGGRRIRTEVPVMQDLLFVHDSREKLDPVVGHIPTLQYRYIRGAYCKPMTVDERDMTRFIQAVTSSESVRYYRPDEITPSMYGRTVRIIGGPLDGIEGPLLSVRGSRSRRLLVNLPDFIAAGVEVEPDYVQIL